MTIEITVCSVAADYRAKANHLPVDYVWVYNSLLVKSRMEISDPEAYDILYDELNKIMPYWDF